MGPVKPLSLIIGPSEVILLYWAMLPGFFVHVVFLVELPVQRRPCPIFIKSWVLEKGTQWCGVELPDIHESSAG